jgi:hypothetical protein
MLREDGGFILLENSNYTGIPEKSAVFLSISKDGNQSFGTSSRREMNDEGNYRNEMTWDDLGMFNELTAQFRFAGFNRFVVNDAVARVY